MKISTNWAWIGLEVMSSLGNARDARISSSLEKFWTLDPLSWRVCLRITRADLGSVLRPKWVSISSLKAVHVIWVSDFPSRKDWMVSAQIPRLLRRAIRTVAASLASKVLATSNARIHSSQLVGELPEK